MPATSGSAIFSRHSLPSRRVTNSARLSSLWSHRGGTKSSMPIRILPGQEMRLDLTSGMIMVGTMSMTPSGRGWRRPPEKMKVPLCSSFEQSISSASPTFFISCTDQYFSGKIAVRSAFDGELADLFRAELAADGLFLFKEGKVHPLFLQIDGAGEGGDPAADDGRLLHGLLSFIRVNLEITGPRLRRGDDFSLGSPWLRSPSGP